MSKDTKILDYAKYVEDDNKLRYEVLKSKGVDVKPNQNLNYYTNKISELPDTDSVYINPFYLELEQSWYDDPLRTANGGEYRFCSIVALNTKYPTTYIYNRTGYSTCLIKTSDGQEIYPDSSDITITWDASKDIKIGSEFFRWIKMYSKETDPRVEMPCYPKNATPYTENNYPTARFVLLDQITHVKQSGPSKTTFGGCCLDYAVLSENLKKYGDLTGTSGSNEAGSINVLKIKSSKIEFTVSTSSANHTTHNIILGSFKTISASGNAYIYCRGFLDLYGTVLNIPYTSYSLTITANSIQLPEILTNIYNLKFSNITELFLTKSNLALTVSAKHLKNLSLVKDFDVDLKLYTPSINTTSFENIVNNLKDLSSENTKTLTILSELIGYIDESLLTRLSEKNWTLSIVNE